MESYNNIRNLIIKNKKIILKLFLFIFSCICIYNIFIYLKLTIKENNLYRECINNDCIYFCYEQSHYNKYFSNKTKHNETSFIPQNYTIIFDNHIINSHIYFNFNIFNNTIQINNDNYSWYEYCYNVEINSYNEFIEMVYLYNPFDKLEHITDSYPYLMLLSIIFLIIIFIDIIIKKKKTIQNKLILIYITSLTSTYFNTFINNIFQFELINYNILCKSIGYIILISLLISFLSITLLSLHILSFITYKHNITKNIKNCYIIIFSIVFIYILTIFIFNESDIVPIDYHPNIGSISCFISSNNLFSTSIFLYCPMIIIILYNILIYVIILYNLIINKIIIINNFKIKYNEDSYSILKNKIKTIKTCSLFSILLVVSWLVEILSGSIKEVFILYLLSIINTLHGNIIFLIYIYYNDNNKNKLNTSYNDIIYKPCSIIFNDNKINTNEINTNEINTNEINTNEINTNEINTNEININEINTNEINTN